MYIYTYTYNYTYTCTYSYSYSYSYVYIYIYIYTGLSLTFTSASAPPHTPDNVIDTPGLEAHLRLELMFPHNTLTLSTLHLHIRKAGCPDRSFCL